MATYTVTYNDGYQEDVQADSCFRDEEVYEFRRDELLVLMSERRYVRSVTRTAE